MRPGAEHTQTMNRLLILAIPLLFFAVCPPAYATGYKPDSYVYCLESAGVGTNESVLVRVKCDVKNPAEAAEIASECAVHGIIFAGCSATELCLAQTPLFHGKELTVPQTEYFDKFFNNDSHKQYVVSVAGSNMKIIRNKKSYTIEVVVAVDKRKLRRDLERDGMVEKLGAAFEKK